MIERLDTDIEEMNRLVGDMLELARGLGRETPADIDVAELLDALAQPAREAGMNVEVAAERCVVSVAPMALRRLLGNLLSNAQRYWRRRSGGTVFGPVRIRRPDRRPGPRSRDSGGPDRSGIPTVPSRGCRRAIPGTGGSGLGLAIVRQLAQANGWTVSLENRAGGGLAAWVTLPTVPRPT